MRGVETPEGAIAVARIEVVKFIMPDGKTVMGYEGDTFEGGMTAYDVIAMTGFAQHYMLKDIEREDEDGNGV